MIKIINASTKNGKEIAYVDGQAVGKASKKEVLTEQDILARAEHHILWKRKNDGFSIRNIPAYREAWIKGFKETYNS